MTFAAPPQLHRRLRPGQTELDGGTAGGDRRNSVRLRGGRENLVQPLQQDVRGLQGPEPRLGLHQPVCGHLQELRRYDLLSRLDIFTDTRIRVLFLCCQFSSDLMTAAVSCQLT